MPRLSVLAAAATVILVSPVGAQPSQEARRDEPALSGPRLSPASHRPTLVQREFDGRLKRLEGHPVHAALKLIDLSPAERAAAERVLLDRSLAIERIMRENMRLVLEAQGAFKPGDDGRGQEAVVKLYQMAQPIFNKGRLVDLVAAALPEQKAAEMKRLVAEYMNAAVADRMAGNVDGKKQDRFGAYLGENGELFGKEIEAAAKRTFEGGEREFAELSKKLQLTPEQESKIQGLFIDMMTRDYARPSKWQQMQTILGAYKLLTDEQRALLREIMAEEARDAARRRRAEGAGK